MSPRARASDSLIARNVRPACESAARESAGIASSLRVRIDIERGEALVSEHVAIALRRVLHPVALGLLGQLDEPGGERLGLGRHGLAGVEVQLAHLDPQRIHVRIGRAELPERLVDAEDRVLRERDAARMGGRDELVQLDERLVDAGGEARRSAPRGLARRLRDRREALPHGDGVDRADGEGNLHVERGRPAPVCARASSVTGAKRARSLRAMIAIA